MTQDAHPDSSAALTRREFTLQSALALLSGVIITVSGCGSDSTPTTPTPTATDVTGAIGTNHGHVAVITAAQQTSANAFTLNIQGTAAHPHTVELSQAELRSLVARQAVSKVSSTDNGHSHTVTFTLA